MRATGEATACYHCHFLARQLAGSMPYATLRAEQDGLGPSDNDIWAGHQVSPNILILSINSSGESRDYTWHLWAVVGLAKKTWQMRRLT